MEKNPMSVYVGKRLRRSPCLCVQGEGWESPHVCVNRKGVRKAPISMYTRMELRRPSCLYVQEGVENSLMCRVLVAVQKRSGSARV